jgi:hypothetical protein
MYNFPNNPSVGQTTPDGNWIWDGEKWNPTSTLPQQLAPRENILINGGFDVWQRGDSITYPGFSFFTADRWVSPSFTTVNKVDSPFRNGANAAQVTAASFLVNPIELHRTGGDAPFEMSASYTLQFKSDQQPPVVFIAGRDVSTSDTNEKTFATINTFNTTPITGGFLYTATFTLTGGFNPTNTSLCVVIQLEPNQVLGDVKLEQGSTATDWVYEDIGTTLAKCQRYYEKFLSENPVHTFCSGLGIQTQSILTMHFKQAKRTIPTLEVGTAAGSFNIYMNGYVVASSIAINNPSTNSAGLVVNHATIGAIGDCVLLRANSTAQAYLAFDAEL